MAWLGLSVEESIAFAAVFLSFVSLILTYASKEIERGRATRENAIRRAEACLSDVSTHMDKVLFAQRRSGVIEAVMRIGQKRSGAFGKWLETSGDLKEDVRYGQKDDATAMSTEQRRTIRQPPEDKAVRAHPGTKEYRRAKHWFEVFAPTDETSNDVDKDLNHVTWRDYTAAYTDVFSKHSGLLTAVGSLYGEQEREDLRQIFIIFECVHRMLMHTLHYGDDGLLDFPWTGEERAQMKPLIWKILAGHGSGPDGSNEHVKTQWIREKGKALVQAGQVPDDPFTGVGLGLKNDAEERISDLLGKMEEALKNERVGVLREPGPLQRLMARVFMYPLPLKKVYPAAKTPSYMV